MECVVSGARFAMLSGALLLVWLAPIPASAQSQPQPPAPTAAEPEASRLWLVAGGTFTTLRADCEAPPSPLSPVTCGAGPYRHSAGVLTNVGYRVSRRLDVGADLFWMPQDTSSGRIHVTHLNAVGQFRPWTSRGFFIKGGAGMAYLRNWVDALGPQSINQKALSVVVGAGWAFRPAARVGLQIFGSQHAGAVGDVETADGLVQNVMGNFWSLGAGIVIR